MTFGVQRSTTRTVLQTVRFARVGVPVDRAGTGEKRVVKPKVEARLSKRVSTRRTVAVLQTDGSALRPPD